jgi:hypothetical protein
VLCAGQALIEHGLAHLKNWDFLANLRTDAWFEYAHIAS